MNSIQCEAYEIAGMVAVATFHGWRVNVLTDGSVNFDPPDGERDAGEIRKVRSRLLLAAFLAKEQFLGHHDEEAGTAACDAAARELAAAFDTEIDLWRHLVVAFSSNSYCDFNCLLPVPLYWVASLYTPKF